ETGFYLSRVQPKNRQLLREVQFDLDALIARLPVNQRQCFGERDPEVTREQGGRSLTPGCQHVVHEVIQAADFVLDVGEVPLHYTRRAVVAVKMLGADLIDGEVDEIQRVA